MNLCTLFLSCCPPHPLQLSNHTGYPLIKGHVFDGAHLQDLLAGLTGNGLICHTHLLTGAQLCRLCTQPGRCIAR
jgi:pyridoxine kinase